MPALPVMLYFIFKLPRLMTQDFVVKLQYNKDRDLVFVTKGCQNAFSKKLTEHVHETTHLQCLPPSVGISMKLQESLMTVTDMYSDEVMYLYTDPKYWNQDLSVEFQDHLFAMWK